MKQLYWYEITFKDGRYVRRENISKKMAQAMHDSMVYEMHLFGVKETAWGVMQ